MSEADRDTVITGQPLVTPILKRYNKFWRDKGYKWSQRIITFTNEASVFGKRGYTGHADNGEEWCATQHEMISLFEQIPVNPYLVEEEGRKEIRLARLRAYELRQKANP